MSTASRIRKARRNAGFSQSQLADLMKVTRSACGQWEMEGGTTPRGHRLERLASILNVTVEWLATGEGAPEGAPRTADGVPIYRNGLTDDERTLLDAYSHLDGDTRKALLVLLRPSGKRRR